MLQWGTEGAKLAQEIMENELIMGTEAYRNGNLIYLSIRLYGIPQRAVSVLWIR